MKKKKVLSVLLATAVAGSMVSVTAGCGNVGGGSKSTTVYFAGDSTVCEFAGDGGANGYFMPRYGYGTQFANYVSDKVTVRNLAYSGSSSYSFTKKENYTTIKNNIKAGDYLIIGFGHNDESADSEETNVERYTNPNLATNVEGSIADLVDTAEARPVSFKYCLNKFYIEMAQEKGAIPILCTPIVRLSNKDDYTGERGHNTEDRTVDDVTYPGGNYAQAIKDLGTEKNVTVIDLKMDTQADYVSLGYDNVKNRHASEAARWADASKTQKEAKSIDNTHTNYFGASLNAYYLAADLKQSGNSLGQYVNSDISKPTYNEAFVINSQYTVPANYFNPATDASQIWNITAPWYGTVFGDVGMNSKFNEWYTVQQNAPGNYTVGGKVKQEYVLDTDSFVPKYNGKFSSNSDGFAAAFFQMETSANFEITAEVTLDVYTGNLQTGFGLMLRDNIVIDEKLEKADSVKGDYIAAGAYTSGSESSIDTNIIFSRSDETNSQGVYTANKLTKSKKTDKDLTDGELTEGSTHTLKIKKVGSKVTATFDNVSVDYTKNFDLTKIDDAYMYLCLFATRGTTATFNLTEFTVNNVSQLG